MHHLPTLGIVSMLLSLSSFAQGDLLITPKRIVFDNNQQKEEINLVNIGTDTATFSISFVQYNMKEDGSFVLIDKPDSGQLFADPYLRIFPPKVRLAPREPQVISLQCRRTADMGAGEYRSHLYFRSEKNNQAANSSPIADSSKLKIQLTPVFGLSIPIIIRQGELSLHTNLTGLSLATNADQNQVLNLTINREGASSVYGDISIQYIPPVGAPLEVGRLNNVGVYTNISRRNVAVKIKSKTTLTAGRLRVQYLAKKERSDVLQAEAMLDIN